MEKTDLKLVETPEEVVEEKQEVIELTEEKAKELVEQHDAGKVIGFTVGLSGNPMYDVVSDSEISLKDIVEAISTIHINSIAAILDQLDTSDDSVITSIAALEEMRKEITARSIELIGDQLVAAEKLNKEQLEKIKEIF